MDSYASSDFECETLTVESVASILGINRSTAYQHARTDQLPVPVIGLGRRMVVSRRALDRLLESQHGDIEDGSTDRAVSIQASKFSAMRRSTEYSPSAQVTNGSMVNPIDRMRDQGDEA